MGWPLLLLGAGLLAQPSAGQPADGPAGLAELLDGDMARLQVQTRPVPEATFTAADGASMTLDAYRGKHVLVNFWAPWCAPCREEMPQLSELQAEFASTDFEVVTIAVGRNRRGAMKRFLNDVGAENLPLHADPGSRLSGAMGVLGLPVTVLLDPAGREVARLQGAADWASADALALVEHLISD